MLLELTPQRGDHRRAHGPRQPPAADDRARARARRAARASRGCSSIFDLDGFKGYNDAFGHPAGDALLQRLGSQLADASPRDGTRLPARRRRVLPPRPARRARRRGSARRRAASALARGGRGVRDRHLLRRGLLPDRRERPAPGARRGRRSGSTPTSTRSTRGATVRTRCCSRRSTSASPTCSDTRAASPRSPSTSAAALGLARRRRSRSSSAPRSSTTSARSPIPDQILRKPGPLTRRRVGVHPPAHARRPADPRRLPGAAAQSATSSARRTSAGTAPATPTASPATDIPLAARIIAVCDAFDAMTADPPLPHGARRRGRRSTSSSAAPARSSTRTSSPSSTQRPSASGSPRSVLRGRRQPGAILSRPHGGGSSVGRAPGCGPGGRGFESRPPPRRGGTHGSPTFPLLRACHRPRAAAYGRVNRPSAVERDAFLPLTCRSLIALLIDRSALPCTLTAP